MARDVSIVFSAKDNFSASLVKIIDKQKETKKSSDELQKTLDTFNQTKAELKIDSEKAKTKLKEANDEVKKAVAELEKLEQEMADTTEATERLAKATENDKKATEGYGNIQGQLKLVSKQAKQTEKDLMSLYGMNSKEENKAAAETEGGFVSRLGQSGAAKAVAEMATELAGNYISSAYGKNTASMVSSALSYMGTGAAIGTAIAPGVGTAIGGVVGGAAGLIMGTANQQKELDEHFKAERDDVVSGFYERYAQAVQNGAAVASDRETNRLAFATLLKSNEKAEEFTQSLIGMANKTPFQYSDLTALSRTLLSYGYAPEDALAALTSIGNAGSALNMDSAGMNMVATALGRMKTTGKTSLEYVNMLQERGINVIEILGNEYGKNPEEIYNAISKNLIDGAEAAKVIQQALDASYGGSMEKLSQTYSGMSSTLEDAKDELDSIAGESYNTARKEGIAEETAWLDSGEMKTAYEALGKYQAELENEAERARREALKAVMDSAAYKEAEKSGEWEEMGKLIAAAEAAGRAAYNGSELFAQSFEMEKGVIEAVGTALAADKTFFNAGYLRAEEYSKGFKAYMAAAANELFAFTEGEDPYTMGFENAQEAFEYYNAGNGPWTEYEQMVNNTTNNFDINVNATDGESIARELVNALMTAKFTGKN